MLDSCACAINMRSAGSACGLPAMGFVLLAVMEISSVEYSHYTMVIIPCASLVSRSEASSVLRENCCAFNLLSLSFVP